MMALIPTFSPSTLPRDCPLDPTIPITTVPPMQGTQSPVRLLHLLFLFLTLSFGAHTLHAQATNKPVTYEYASVRFDGHKTCIVWPDGNVEKVAALIGNKEYEPADFRIWYLTEAMNHMGTKGYHPVRVEQDVFWRMDPVDVWIERDLID